MRNNKGRQVIAKNACTIGSLGSQYEFLMGASKCYYLKRKNEDFAEPYEDEHHPGSDSIVFVNPANDNTPTRARLLARCTALFLGLAARRGDSLYG